LHSKSDANFIWNNQTIRFKPPHSKDTNIVAIISSVVTIGGTSILIGCYFFWTKYWRKPQQASEQQQQQQQQSTEVQLPIIAAHNHPNGTVARKPVPPALPKKRPKRPEVYLCARSRTEIQICNQIFEILIRQGLPVLTRPLHENPSSPVVMGLVRDSSKVIVFVSEESLETVERAQTWKDLGPWFSEWLTATQRSGNVSTNPELSDTAIVLITEANGFGGFPSLSPERFPDIPTNVLDQTVRDTIYQLMNNYTIYFDPANPDSAIADIVRIAGMSESSVQLSQATTTSALIQEVELSEFVSHAPSTPKSLVQSPAALNSPIRGPLTTAPDPAVVVPPAPPLPPTLSTGIFSSFRSQPKSQRSHLVQPAPVPRIPGSQETQVLYGMGQDSDDDDDNARISLFSTNPASQTILAPVAQGRDVGLDHGSNHNSSVINNNNSGANVSTLDLIGQIQAHAQFRARSHAMMDQDQN
jgi:hypothetical protein